MDKIQFAARTARITIDPERCEGCTTFACVKACSLFGTGIFRVEGNRPDLVFDLDEARRRCNECLGCERFCQMFGQGGLQIEVDTFGLEGTRKERSGNPG